MKRQPGAFTCKPRALSHPTENSHRRSANPRLIADRGLLLSVLNTAFPTMPLIPYSPTSPAMDMSPSVKGIVSIVPSLVYSKTDSSKIASRAGLSTREERSTKRNTACHMIV